MFGLSWDQIILILLAALFLLGPERIPTAIKWIMDSLRKVRTFAAGAQSEMRSQLGPELDELRRQIAELQSLKEIKELKELRDLDPRRLVGKSILGDEFSGSIKGFLGLTGDGPDSAVEPAAGGTPGGGAAGAAVAPQPAVTPASPDPLAQPAPPLPSAVPAGAGARPDAAVPATVPADGPAAESAIAPAALAANNWGDAT